MGKRLRAVTLALAAIAAIVVPAGQASAETLIVRIQNMATEQYLAIPGGNTGEGVAAIQWPARASSEQYWAYDTAVGWGTLRNVKTGKCLTFDGGPDGTAAVQRTCRAPSASNYKQQQWSANRTGWHQLISLYGNGQCLSIGGGSSTPGAKAILWGCSLNPDQKWFFELVD
jgi:hypothetical protein